ncbi:MBL fold metallo-hydrolase [Clostridium sp. DJ247]|uniref:MBL fold metallo-hydrolase n=1 Tax=Clostridium sp. DJ247 TaxID=2726188 RepID=UPI0016295711|nr:MBL fold metallo-hydrolase [Clostridium sp. DJ247]MBC2582557.1 MBL fold metallo-hydrolase [Clostridium sp. DJ247]
MKVSFLGGAHEVGGSCILLKIYNKNILLDCGIRQGTSKDPLPNFKTIQEQGGIDAIIISHAHMDHIGSLPIISKEYPNARIYTNKMTKDLMKVLLYDSLKIMNNREAEIPLYAEADVENMLNRIFAINYMMEFPIFEDISMTFYTAGHIAGASCVYITTKEGSVFYSGDFSIFPQKTVEGLKVPKLRPDAAIFETTYGDRLHSNREIEEERLVELIKQCEANKGKMLIPAFALGRSQEILLIIKKALNKKVIKNIKVYVDGMIKDINRVYKLNPLYLKNSLGKKVLRGIEPFYDDNIVPVDKKELREKILEEKDPCIIVASSGMLTGGYSQYYAEKIASMENGYIVITGYQDEESPGRKLLKLLEEEDKRLDLNGKVIPVRCRVEKVGLSAHGDKGEIKALINLLSPKDVFMVHGNEEVIEGFARELSSEIRARVYAPKCGEDYEININNPRKQWKKQMPQIIQSSEELKEDNIEKLWKFVLDNYGQKLFTIEELVYIWTGNNRLKPVDVDKVQKLIIDSAYFESDMKRLFLFKSRTKEEVEEDKKQKDLKPNELNDFINKHFSKFNFKKASLIYGEKKVVLNFDFPDVVDKSIYEVMEQFEKQTNWKVELNNTLNINAASSMLQEIFYHAGIKKISYKLEEKKAVVMLNSNIDLQQYNLENFNKTTGLQIVIQNPGENKECSNNLIVSKNQQNLMEQNQALALIDEAFKKEEFRPYKKAIKSNGVEKYIELYFISPIIGKKYEKILYDLVELTGWNMIISSAVNQNEIINLAIILCKKQGINLKKNPSFNGANLSVELKLENFDEEKMKAIKEEFEYKTGCAIRW